MSLTISKLMRALEAELVNNGDMPVVIGLPDNAEGEGHGRIYTGYKMIMSPSNDGNKRLFIVGENEYKQTD